MQSQILLKLCCSFSYFCARNSLFGRRGKGFKCQSTVAQFAFIYPTDHIRQISSGSLDSIFTTSKFFQVFFRQAYKQRVKSDSFILNIILHAM